jgi:hypothetical protein
MSDTERLTARIALLSQLVRLIMREQAVSRGKTADDIKAFAEDVRVFFEERLPPGTTEMYINAEVTSFFDVLAREVGGSKES